MLTFLRGATWGEGIITKWQWDDWDEGDSHATQVWYSGVLTRSPIRPLIYETYQMGFTVNVRRITTEVREFVPVLRYDAGKWATSL
jgi:hypothetical protein